MSVTGYSKTLFFDFINQLEKRMTQKSLSEVEEIEGKKFHIIIHGGEANPEVYRKIEDETFCIIDIETTGVTREDKIVSVAIVDEEVALYES